VLLATDEEYAAVVAYIAEHRAEFKDEYQLVLRQAAANHLYWEERNRARVGRATAAWQDNDLESVAARLRREIDQRDLELVNQ
jgi:hypothetical protein